MLSRRQTPFMMDTLEVFFMVYAIGALLWTSSNRITSVIAIRGVCLFYILGSYLYAVVYKESDLLDFLMIYKSFVYIFFLTFLAGKRLITTEGFFKLFNVLLAVFFLKYFITVGLGLYDRPTVYFENNFELMILYALYLLRYSFTKQKYLHILALLGAITVMSLSRSSLLMFGVLSLYVCWDSFKKTRVFILPIAGLFLGGVIYYIFSQRSGSLEEVDRYKFFLIFLDHTKNWNFWEYLVGDERITPLGYYACQSLSFYKNLFSYSGDGTCYSVILHSFLLRVIIDHGFLGLFFILGSTLALLRKSGVRLDVSLVFIAVVVVNGLSVSSFNNLFYALSMVILMVTNKYIPFQEDEYLEEQNDEMETDSKKII
jgi:hypothetical protein